MRASWVNSTPSPVGGNSSSTGIQGSAQLRRSREGSEGRHSAARCLTWAERHILRDSSTRRVPSDGRVSRDAVHTLISEPWSAELPLHSPSPHRTPKRPRSIPRRLYPAWLRPPGLWVLRVRPTRRRRRATPHRRGTPTCTCLGKCLPHHQIRHPLVAATLRAVTDRKRFPPCPLAPPSSSLLPGTGPDLVPAYPLPPGRRPSALPLPWSGTFVHAASPLPCPLPLVGRALRGTVFPTGCPLSATTPTSGTFHHHRTRRRHRRRARGALIKWASLVSQTCTEQW